MTRYDLEVLRRALVDRYLFALAILAIAGGCGAAPPHEPTLARGEPLPVTDNQQGHTEPVSLADESADVGPLPTEQPSIAGVYLWCSAPSGRACALASAALGTGHKDPSGLPPSLLSVEDRTNDCDEPTIVTVSGRLATAFSVQPTGWRDQGGTYLDMSTIGDMYQAAGCINDADTSHPIAKISAADGASPRVYLVRVWDAQPPPAY